MSYKTLLLSTAVLTSLASGAQAATVTETYNFSLSNFVDVTGNAVAPINAVSGSFTLTFDPAVAVTDQTAGITVNSITPGIVLDPGLSYGFSTFPGTPYGIEIGGTGGGNAADLVYEDTNDFILSLQFTSAGTLNDPIQAVCGTGFTCGSYSGNQTVYSSGYTVAGSDDTFFATIVDLSPAVPEPSTWVMMILGFAGVGFMAHRRKNNNIPLELA